jgi:hypothetical protein
MTEADWLFSDDPAAMLEVLLPSGKASERKLGLYLVACVRCSMDQATEEIAMALATEEKRLDNLDGLPVWNDKKGHPTSWIHRRRDNLRLLMPLFKEVLNEPFPYRHEQARLLHDIFGNPFRASPAFVAAWRTPAVLGIALAAYDQLSFDSLPELASALEKTGCTHAALLEHFRTQGPHVRGCWGLDVVLDKR